MQRLKQVAVGTLAVVGAMTLGFYVLIKVFVGRECEEEVLSRVVSPSGALAAQHVRKACNGGAILEHVLEIQPARPGVGDVSTSRLIFRAETERDYSYALSIKPFRLWWVAEDKLHVEYPRSVTLTLGGQLGSVRVEAQQVE